MSIAKGNVTATAASAQIVAASNDRAGVTLQLQSGNPVSVAFGADAVFGEGLQMAIGGDTTIKVTGQLARRVINGICDTGKTGVVGFQEY